MTSTKGNPFHTRRKWLIWRFTVGTVQTSPWRSCSYTKHLFEVISAKVGFDQMIKPHWGLNHQPSGWWTTRSPSLSPSAHINNIDYSLKYLEKKPSLPHLSYSGFYVTRAIYVMFELFDCYAGGLHFKHRLQIKMDDVLHYGHWVRFHLFSWFCFAVMYICVFKSSIL